MLKDVMKFFKPAQAESQEEVVTMTQATEQPVAAADNTAVAEMAAQLASQSEQMTALQAQFAELTTKYEAAEAALAQSADAQATLVANAKAAVLASRTASLSAIMGDIKGPVTAAKLEALDDAAFAVVLDSYAASFAAEEKSEMFKEAGVSAEAKQPVEEADTATRLAATFAAQAKQKK